MGQSNYLPSVPDTAGPVSKFSRSAIFVIYRTRARTVSVAAALLSVSLPALAQQNPIPDNPTPPAPQPGRPGTPHLPPAPRPALPAGVTTVVPGAPAAPPVAPAPGRVRPYSEIITDKAHTEVGLFKTHQIEDRVFFEIPTTQLGKELLWVTTFRQTQTGYGYGGTEVQNRVVRWEKRGDRILLRSVDYQARADTEGSLKRALALASVEPILMTFDVRAYNEKNGGAPVIDVTPLLVGDPAEFSPRRQIGPGAHIDAARTFVDRIKSLPENIEMDVLATFALAPGTPSLLGGGRPTPPDGPQRDSGTEAVTVVLHHSMVTLPAVPMKPRLFDDRVGYFASGFYEFGSPENRVKEVRYIHRWRLDKKDPRAALSEPVKPIVYYIGPEVPAKWRPYLKQAIEDWQPAFEQAGFKNAIVARDAPTPAEDPQFDPDDVRYSVIRWLPSATENAYGPSITDPRTGEILNADIKIYHNLLKLSETWYFTQASPNDPRARKLPLPDDLMGQLLRYAVSHEVGHTLGLRHNMKASSTYSIAQLRDPKWTALWGDEASIMDYGRFNYVAQPGDGARLIPKQGPYDLFAIEWGYSPLTEATTHTAEKIALDNIAVRQIKNPMLQFGPGPEDSDTRDDPTQQTEDLGSDPIAATTLGFKNLDRVLTYLVPATENRGDDYARLQEMYDAVFAQRDRELDHVAVLVGGVLETSNHYSEGGSAVYAPVPAAQQRAALTFLVKNCFVTTSSLLRPDILSRFEAAGASDRVLAEQSRILARLTADTRLKRLADFEAQPGNTATYTLTAMMTDLRKGIWTEITAGTGPVLISPYRRNLQRAYIGALAAKVSGDPTVFASPVRPAARGALLDTRIAILAALPRVTDVATRQHLVDCGQIIRDLLYPRGS